MKAPGLHIDRAKISMPVALLSTTNMLSYNAPDIATLRHPSGSSTSSKASTHSADDSDASAISGRSRSSSETSNGSVTDASSVENSPTWNTPNLTKNLEYYFTENAKPPPAKAPRRSASSGNLQELKSAKLEGDSVPAIPERALSHSKRAHERLAQKRSLQNIGSRSSTRSSRSSLREHRTSADMFRGVIEEENHPFGKELEQLNEVAEEFGTVVASAELEADIAAIREHKLGQFCAADYLAEIQPLFSSRFETVPAPMAWI